MFVGRSSELKKLEQLYLSGQFEFAVFYGRRRVGKTTLINEFCNDKRTINFVGIESTEKENLESFSRAVFEITMPGMELPAFSSFEQLFDHMAQAAENERLILVIDEYPYLAGAKPTVSSILQTCIDRRLKNSKLFLILCGSSMSFMENQVLGYKSPLYGRRTSQFKVLPFTFFEAALLLEGFAPEEQAVLYGVTGGVPEYLSRIRSTLSLKDNLLQLFFDPAGRLFEEPSNLLKQELRDPATYNAIITAIANGASKLNEIAGKVGIESSACSNLLASMISLGLVKKDIPVTEKVSRKTIYLLEDRMFRFWYRFVGPNLNSITAGHGERVFNQKVQPLLNDFMGLVFEQICKDYLTRKLPENELPFFFTKIGRWWGNNPKEKREEEIDILAFDGDKAIFGECKWTNESVDHDVYADLEEQSSLFRYTEKYLYLFAKRDFSDRCKRAVAELQNVRLISFSEMCSHKSKGTRDHL